MLRCIFVVIVFLFACEKKVDPIDTNIGQPISIYQVRTSLAKGINLENWFNDYSDPNQYINRFTSADLMRIKSQGFTCIRLPISTSVLFQVNNPSELNSTNLKFVDAAVNAAISNGLSVVFDAIHNSDDTFEKNLATVSGYDEKVSAYWSALAKYFSKYPTDKIFFEVYNEPHVGTTKYNDLTVYWWWPKQLKFIQAIRSVTANHYIIAGAEGWNGRSNLLSSIPYSEKNIIYNFHTYDPFLFTHQGATWTGWEPALQARGVPYPSKQSAIDSLIKATNVQSLKDALAWYGSQQYNIDSLNNWMKPVDFWAKKYNVLVICNEFGSYKLYASKASRLAWIHDMRLALEQNNIPWAMWEFDNGFGFTTYTNNDRSKTETDENVLISLGLR